MVARRNPRLSLGRSTGSDNLIRPHHLVILVLEDSIQPERIRGTRAIRGFKFGLAVRRLDQGALGVARVFARGPRVGEKARLSGRIHRRRICSEVVIERNVLTEDNDHGKQVPKPTPLAFRACRKMVTGAPAAVMSESAIPTPIAVLPESVMETFALPAALSSNIFIRAVLGAIRQHFQAVGA
jgi:hypothetical protein